MQINDSVIILLSASLLSISNQSMVNENYIENEALVSTVRFFKIRLIQKDIHFKTQPGPVAKNATPRSPAGN